MIRIFKTEDGAIHQIDEAEAGCWIALTNPTATEILEIAERYEIDRIMSGHLWMRKNDPVLKLKITTA